MKNVLVTGGTGFLGANLTKRLLKLDQSPLRDVETIIIPTTRIRTNTALHLLGVKSNKINLVQGDIRDFEFLKLLFNDYEFDTVFHLGAQSEVRKCQRDAKLAFDVNINGTINVLEACRLYSNVEAIAVSSSVTAYGVGELPYREETPLNGKAIYEVSKSCVDLVARAYANNCGVPIVVTRCTNLYGPGDNNLSRVIPNNIRKILIGKSPMVWKGSEAVIREFLYVEDAADAYFSLIENINTVKGNVYNIGSGERLTIGELVQKLIDKINPSLEISYLEKDFPEITHQYSDCTKIKNDINWNPKTMVDDGLDKTIKFYRELYK